MLGPVIGGSFGAEALVQSAADYRIELGEGVHGGARFGEWEDDGGQAELGETALNFLSLVACGVARPVWMAALVEEAAHGIDSGIEGAGAFIESAPFGAECVQRANAFGCPFLILPMVTGAAHSTPRSFHPRGEVGT